MPSAAIVAHFLADETWPTSVILWRAELSESEHGAALRGRSGGSVLGKHGPGAVAGRKAGGGSLRSRRGAGRLTDNPE